MSRRVFILFISILVTGFVWIVADLYHAYRQTFLPSVAAGELKSVNPRLDTAVVKVLKEEKIN